MILVRSLFLPLLCLIFRGIEALVQSSISEQSFGWIQDEEQRAGVERQLGYLPPNFLRVSARTMDTNEALAIQTYPLAGGSPRRQAKSDKAESRHLGTPFPTLFWFCHAAIGKAIAEMERKGYVGEIEKEILASRELSAQLIKCHDEYAELRWLSLLQEHRDQLVSTESSSIQRMRGILQFSGIAGTNLTRTDEASSELIVPSVKCLHAHYAHYRSTTADQTPNPVGQLVHSRLQVEFPSLML